MSDPCRVPLPEDSLELLLAISTVETGQRLGQQAEELDQEAQRCASKAAQLRQHATAKKAQAVKAIGAKQSPAVEIPVNATLVKDGSSYYYEFEAETSGPKKPTKPRRGKRGKRKQPQKTGNGAS